MISSTHSAPLKTEQARKRAFSLVELLVVVAVIAILASLAVPALGRGRQSSHSVSCVSNLRQLGLASQLYWDDHDGRTFRYRSQSTNNGDVYWFGWIERGGEGARRFDPQSGALARYLGGRGPEICPSLNYAMRDFKLKAVGAAYGYGYNLLLSPTPNGPAIRITDAKTPSSLLVLADSAQVNDFQSPASPEHPMLEEFYYLNTTEPTAHFRHSEKLNAVHADGHVAHEKMLPGTLDTKLPMHHVGRVGDALLEWR